MVTGTKTATRINWGPYLTGIGIGVLSWIVFVVVNNPIGITTALSQVSGGVASLFVGSDVVAANKYWANNAFKLDYGTLFLVGTLLGGILYALSFNWVSQAILPVWAMGKLQLPELLGVGAPLIFAAFGLFAITLFAILERRSAKAG